MFRISFFVEDKRLPQALMALDGLALNLEVQPVRGAIQKKGHVAESGEPLTAREFVKRHVLAAKQQGVSEITTKAIREAGINAGYTEGAVSQAITVTAAKDKILKRLAMGSYRISG